ncbi:hypothetical protein, partial [Acidithiobacillus caldus]|uniref:hypothetical protein n=1 Tax=Acidithiobacillus caldus TaxID=33059 RepID=UPI001C0681F2
LSPLHLDLPADQPLDPQGDQYRVPHRADLDSAHNKDHHPEDLDLVALSFITDRREGLRRGHDLVREVVHRRVAQEDRGLNSPPKDL